MGWSADFDNNESSTFKWQPVLWDDYDGHCIFIVPTYLETKEKCEEFIKNAIIPNAGTMDPD